MGCRGAVSPNNAGWGYQGVCWKCGKIGQKKEECRAVKAVEEGGEEPVEMIKEAPN